MPIKSKSGVIFLKTGIPNPSLKQMSLDGFFFFKKKKNSNSIDTAPPKKGPRTQFSTHHVGELELEERKEKRSRSPKTEWSWAMVKAPSYLSRTCDVTYANRADQMTRWNIFNFLRAHGKESRGSRPLEGDRDIFRSWNNCVKTPRRVCQDLKHFLKMISVKEEKL